MCVAGECCRGWTDGRVTGTGVKGSAPTMEKAFCKQGRAVNKKKSCCRNELLLCKEAWIIVTRI